MAAGDPSAQVLPLKNSRRVILYSFSDDDLATDVDQIKHPANCVAGSSIRLLFFSPADPGERVQSRRFGRTQEIEFDDSLDILVRLLLMTHR